MDQPSLFGSPQEKGSREWAAFNTIREAKPGMFRVAQPQAPARTTVIEQPKPYRGRLFPRPAH